MDLEGRVALVTGGARRVGRAISVGLAGAGADVVINFHSSEDEAKEVIGEIEAIGRRAAAVRADVGSATGIAALIQRTGEVFGRLDVLINNASLFERTPFGQITPEAWDRVMAVNLKGPFFLSQAAAPMLGRDGGAIVNIADLSAVQAWPSFAHHSVSKAGLLHLTRVLARILAPAVRVNCVVPGTVLPPEDFDGEDNAGGRERRAVRREGRPGDVVEAVLFLLRSDFVTGESITVDGGRLLL